MEISFIFYSLCNICKFIDDYFMFENELKKSFYNISFISPMHLTKVTENKGFCLEFKLFSYKKVYKHFKVKF